MKELWDQIYHRKKERKGLTVMLLIILAALFFRYYYLNNVKPAHRKYQDLLSKVDFVDIENEYQSKTKKQYTKKEKNYPSPIRFSFDPNSLSADSFALLGLPSYIGKNIDKYRSKGGKFRTTSDFKKIYGIEKFYDNLSDLIVIKDQKTQAASPITTTKKNDTTYSKMKTDYPLKENEIRRVIELNTADSTDLLHLKGVGPFYAKTIIEMREKLGGYVNAKQITEAYGVPDTILRTIGSEWIRLDLTKIRKINLNKADFKTFARHPYIDKKRANALLVFRRVHGDYKETSDIMKIHLISEEDYERLRWYIEI